MTEFQNLMQNRHYDKVSRGGGFVGYEKQWGSKSIMITAIDDTKYPKVTRKMSL